MRVLVALSGGVDSSVAAAMLHARGHDVVGVTLHLWDAAGESKVGRCCAPEDRDDARRTCEHLGVPHYVLDERSAFRTSVVEPFVRAYTAGTTPAPCVACNQHVKLARLVEVADQLGCERIATGHYARIEAAADGTPRLLRGRDRDKDQSYFLYGVPRAVLGRLWFPLGERTKAETRAEGVRLGVPNAAKPDSQELCFVPDGDVRGFIRREGVEGRRGAVVDDTGQVLAQHDGIEAFTVGQRKGLGLGGGAPRYVLRIVGDTVVVGEDAQLASQRLVARRAEWSEPPCAPFEAEVRVRYRHTPARAWIEPVDDGFEAQFFEPQRAITPGQAAVVYRGDEVRGGGIIA